MRKFCPPVKKASRNQFGCVTKAINPQIHSPPGVFCAGKRHFHSEELFASGLAPGSCQEPGASVPLVQCASCTVSWTASYTGHQPVQSKNQDPRARDLSSRLKTEGHLRARWGTHDNFFTSDILIITLLSNFLLRYVVSKLGLGLSTERTGRK